MSTMLDALIKARREALDDHTLPPDASRKWGLALSGGGIRSATFCLGLIRSLARHGTLLRFDMLSTVSGGGYIAAMVGSLFNRAKTPLEAQAVQSALGNKNGAWFLWWLRANGRYLIPSGIKDTVFVCAMLLRNLVGVHFELGLLALLLGMSLAVVNMAGWAAIAQLGFMEPSASYFDMVRWLPSWLPVVWLLLPVLAVAGAVYAVAYWAQPMVATSLRNGRLLSIWLLVLLAGGAFAWAFWRYGLVDDGVGAQVRTTLWIAALGALFVWLVAVPLVRRQLKKRDESQPGLIDAQVRNVLTRRLAFCLSGFGAILILGLVDRTAWVLAFEPNGLMSAGAFLVVAAAVLRAGLPLLSSATKPRGSIAMGSLLWVGRIVGYILTFLLCAWWVSIVFKAAIGAGFRSPEFQYQEAFVVLALFFAPIMAYIAFTGRNFAFLNRSSLHAFYKARLTRSYLGAANERRFGQEGLLGALETVPNVLLASLAGKRIGDVMPGDDMSLDAYRPQASGGPIHMINLCVNQTRDPRGGLFNRDRLGLPLTLVSGGWMNAGQEGWRKLAESAQLSVGAWIAISGAAAAPGLGDRTRGGLSALLTFAGVRTGYWWSGSERAEQTGVQTKHLRTPRLAKSRGLLDELFGVFKGTNGADWFLTDGGHFENTGAYALLAERARVIVLADCGADPLYAFGDLENLVRKARIDLNAEILFQRPKRPNQPAGFGSLNELASPSGTACLAVARVIYDGDAEQTGIMIIVKPNLCEGLPVDLVNFKAKNPDFPQQTTADQFFSEAQWESYFQLGQFMGRSLSPSFLRGMLNNLAEEFEADECTPFDMSPAGSKPIGEQGKSGTNSRLPARIAATAVGTTIGLGAVATIGVSAWQYVENSRAQLDQRNVEERNVFKAREREALRELTALWHELPSRPADGAPPNLDPKAYSMLAAALLRVSDTLCPDTGTGWLLKSPLAQRIYDDGMRGCRAIEGAQRPDACNMLVETVLRDAQNTMLNCMIPSSDPEAAKPRYWIYDYGPRADVVAMHPCDPLLMETLTRRQLQMENFGLAGNGYSSGLLASNTATTMAGRCGVVRPENTVTDVAGSVESGVTVRDIASNIEGSATAAVRSASAQMPEEVPIPIPVPASASHASLNVCKDVTVYVQIYGQTQRDEIRKYREAWRELGASVPPIEDVVATAERAGRNSPRPVSRNTVRFHDQNSAACANALGMAVGMDNWRIEPLSAQFKSSRRTVEVWIAPRASADNG
ncbi:patatin-like phospholipase family protein [Achromobacter insolitus]|uniref:patatin-like phospholipase family protein n=1 Tax=Achromobacter insolitus TaxID=217204 RepID=UPI003670EB9D